MKPQAFFGINKQNTISFQEQRLLEALGAAPADMNQDLRTAQIASSMQKLVDLSIDNVADSTEYIELEDGTIVNNTAHIKEFYANADGMIVRALQKKLGDINESSRIKNQKVACTSCLKEYEIPLDFDYSSFFAVGS